MNATKLVSRAKVADEIKIRVVESILSGASTVEKECAKHDLQTYQVLAWIGKAALQARAPSREVTKQPTSNHELADMLMNEAMNQTQPDLYHAIGQWYVETVLAKKLGQQKKP